MQISHRPIFVTIICIIFLIFIINYHPVNANTTQETIEPITTIITPGRPSITATEGISQTPIAPTPQETTQTPTATQHSTSTFTPVPTSPVLYTPLLYKQPPAITPSGEPDTILFCNTQTLDIPDNLSTGVTSTLTINEPRILVDMDVRTNISHSWVGDIQITLSHQETGKSTTLINRPGFPGITYGCENDNIVAILDDEITSPIENKCASIPPAISGIYTPDEPLNKFGGIPLSGNWSLVISDNNKSNVGRLNDWCLAARVDNAMVVPSPTPTPPTLPNQAFISGISGRPQALPLDCESRSAVDWAKFFGVYINELTFFNQLPISDNPDAGFVGSVYGSWGQIPPAPYGIHAEPIAELLRNYGLSAYAHRPLSWNQLRSEIAAGRPVIAWIIGSVNNGVPVYYTASGGHITVVAPYEHTVIVTGYSETSVYYLNGSYIYSRSIEQFLDSWSVMGNMAVTSNP